MRALRLWLGGVGKVQDRTSHDGERPVTVDIARPVSRVVPLSPWLSGGGECGATNYGDGKGPLMARR